MIKVLLQKEGNYYKALTVSGHALFADKGKDIVCAAVSMLVINTVNSIEKLTADIISVTSDEKKGIITASFPKTYSEKTALLIDSLVLGLKGTKESYPKNIHLEIKEVMSC